MKFSNVLPSVQELVCTFNDLYQLLSEDRLECSSHIAFSVCFNSFVEFTCKLCIQYNVGLRCLRLTYLSHLQTGDFEGVVLIRITPGGPADRAGLKPGDKLLSINETDIEDKTYNEVRVQLPTHYSYCNVHKYGIHDDSLLLL